MFEHREVSRDPGGRERDKGKVVARGSIAPHSLANNGTSMDPGHRRRAINYQKSVHPAGYSVLQTAHAIKSRQHLPAASRVVLYR